MKIVIEKEVNRMNFNFSRGLISQKKGVSGVVTAVLLILLVIAAIGILWVVVQNFVKEGSKGVEGQADCLQTSFESVSASAGADTITIRRTNGNAVLSAIRVSDGTITNPATPVNPAVGVTTTASGFTIVNVGDNVAVSIAFDLASGTSCGLQELDSVVAVA